MTPDREDGVTSDSESDWAIIETAQFQHTPLDTTQRSIRLLEVHRQAEGSIVCCSLIHSTIDGIYDCLSYRWGDDRPSKKILINEKVFFVRDNLYRFLLVAQASRQLEKKIWIDAICIDQDNPKEKNHQVQQMGELYSNASQVHIWLGPADDYHSRTLSQMVSGALWPSPVQPRHRSRKSAQSFAASDDEARQGVAADVAHNEYWRRAWIVQEVSLARDKTVWYGLQDVSWSAFCKAFYPLVLQPTPEDEYAEPVLYQESPLATFVRTRKPNNEQSKQPLRDLLENHAAGLHCSDPRDRIYCLLSVASLQTGLSADYTLGIRDLFLVALREVLPGGCMCSVNTLTKVLGDALPTQPRSSHFPSTRVSSKDKLQDVRIRIRGRLAPTSNQALYWNCQQLFFNGWVLHCLPCRLGFLKTGRLWECVACWVPQPYHGDGSELSEISMRRIALEDGDVSLIDPSARPNSSESFTISGNLILAIFLLRPNLQHSTLRAIKWTSNHRTHHGKVCKDVWPKWNSAAVENVRARYTKVWDTGCSTLPSYALPDG